MEKRPAKPKLLDQVRDRIRLKHYSRRTEDVYVDWAKRFILYHNKRHPQEMGKQEIEEFLTCLARDRKVSASTQNEAKAVLQIHQRPVSDSPKRGVASTVCRGDRSGTRIFSFWVWQPRKGAEA